MDSVAELADGVVDCPVTALFGRGDTRVTRDDVSAWAAHTTGPCTLHELEGGHFYLVPRRAEVIRELVAVLRVPADPGHAR